jgi:hypothetical protein
MIRPARPTLAEVPLADLSFEFVTELAGIGCENRLQTTFGPKLFCGVWYVHAANTMAIPSIICGEYVDVR